MNRVRVVSLRYFDYPIARLSPKAFRVWAMAMQWSCYHATDGLLSADDIEAIGAKPAQLEELFKRRLLELDDQGRTVLSDFRHGPVVADVEGCEVEHQQLSPGALRQRRWRQRKRNTETSRETGESVSVETGVSPTPPSSPSGSGSSLSPNPESSSVLASDLKDLTGSARVANPEPKAKGKHPMPDGFPTEEQRNGLTKYGRKKGLRDSQTEEQIEAVQIWARSSGAKKSCWFATAQGFIRSAASGSDRRPAKIFPGMAEHEAKRQEDARRPYHEPFRREASEPKASPKEALQAIQGALAGIGRRMPA